MTVSTQTRRNTTQDIGRYPTSENALRLIHEAQPLEALEQSRSEARWILSSQIRDRRADGHKRYRHGFLTRF